MKKYNPKSIEAKWQQVWAETNLYRTPEKVDPDKKFYSLDMFPYPSGDLHTGHWYHYAPADTFTRYQLMQGKQLLHPIGFDAFGLPAENAAIKNNIAPAKWTRANVERMTAQLRQIGPMFDWSRTINTSDPSYYRWTQWLFLKLYAAGLAYRAKGWQNWCPKDQTVLANEQVVGEERVCERCGTPVEKREMEQWFFKITDYAERLLADLDLVEWPQRVKTMQQNWIGKSEGAEIEFRIPNSQFSVKVFTTRPDTLGGATFLVLAPEHPLVAKITTAGQRPAVEAYQKQTGRESEIERQDTERDKTGVDTGAMATNPLSGKQIPVWVADYVLMGYGTGAIMAVPAHDERDWQFAERFKLPHLQVLKGKKLPFSNLAPLINSGQFDGLAGREAQAAIVRHLHGQGTADSATNYKLRDWLISRQRYWGAPIPILYCDKCGAVPVPEDQLPVELPLEVEFKPTGKSPLADRPDFYETTCPKCAGPARRETDTMDTFVDSSWYYLRYPNPSYEDGPFDPEAVKAWLPVDQYIGGVEHAILHLLYSRFMTKFLYDQKLVDFQEPFKRLFNQGIILGPDGQKMSKSRGNVVNPDDWVGHYGADAFRMYLMFLGPFDQGGPFDTKGIAGVWRYLNRVWELVHDFTAATPGAASGTAALETRLQMVIHKTTKKVGEDLAAFRFNTMVAALMEALNQLVRLRAEMGFDNPVWGEALKTYIRLMAPAAPHLAEELWQVLGGGQSVFVGGWPQYDPAQVKDDISEVVVQVNGRVRATLATEPGTSEDELKQLAAAEPNVAKYLEGKTIARSIVVPRKLVNFVTKP